MKHSPLPSFQTLARNPSPRISFLDEAVLNFLKWQGFQVHFPYMKLYPLGLGHFLWERNTANTSTFFHGTHVDAQLELFHVQEFWVGFCLGLWKCALKKEYCFFILRFSESVFDLYQWFRYLSDWHCFVERIPRWSNSQQIKILTCDNIIGVPDNNIRWKTNKMKW